jgi:SAM-dependent methyltransferase
LKELEREKFYNINEIYEKLDKRVKKKKLEDFFVENKISGKKIDDEWYGNAECLEEIEEILFREKAIMIDLLEMDLSTVELTGRILDVGGGGEGIIGQLKGANVVAIDRRASELEEAAEGDYLKVIMDATDLKFLDNYFDTVTAFFCLMYVPPSDRKQIFREIYRVLKKGGEFIIWDLIIPEKKNNNQDFYGIDLSINLGKTKIPTGYAIRWNREQNFDTYSKLGEGLGFKIREYKTEKNTFYIRFIKD